MEFLTIFLIALGLAMDALAVSLSTGTCGQIANRRGKIRLAAHLGIFQAGMAFLGWAAGETIVQYVERFDTGSHWRCLAMPVSISSARGSTRNARPSTRTHPPAGCLYFWLSPQASMHLQWD